MRVWALRSRAGALNSDEAVVGLMARHLQHGDLATTFWGQAYGGPHEVVLVAVLFAVGFGGVALEIVAIGLHAATALVVWRIGVRISSTRVAWTAAALCWLGSAAAVLISLRSFALYGIGIFLASLTVLQVLRLDDRPWSRRDWLVLGGLLGSGVWATPQYVWVALPAVTWLAVRQHDELRRWCLTAAGFVVAAGPWLWYGATNDWETLKGPPQSAVDNGYLDHLTGFFREGLPVILGLRLPVDEDWLLGPLVGTAVMVLSAVAVVRTARRGGRGIRLLLLIACSYPFLLALSTHTFYEADGRYLYLLLPVLCVLLASVFARRAAVAVVVTAAFTVVGLHATATEADHADYGALIAALREHHVTRAYADYWVAYRVTFETDEDVIVTPSHGSRHRPYDDAVHASSQPAYIFREADVGGLLQLLTFRRRDASFATFEAGGFVVYVPYVTHP